MAQPDPPPPPESSPPESSPPESSPPAEPASAEPAPTAPVPAAAPPAGEQLAAPPVPTGGSAPRLNRPVWIAVAVIVAIALVAALTVFFANRSADPDAAPAGSPDRVASGPLAGQEEATFVLLDGAASVTLRAQPLDDLLYRAETPDGGEHLPVVTVAEEEVRLELTESGEAGASAVEVVLNADVRWHVRILAGATEQIVDLGEGSVSGVELAGGASRIELTLPPPQGTTEVRMSTGAGDWYLHQVGDAPVQVRVGAGAGTVTIDGEVESGVAGGTVFTPAGWDAATDRVDVDAAAGMSSLVVDRQ